MQHKIVHIFVISYVLTKPSPHVQLANASMIGQARPMSRQDVNHICAGFPGATAADPTTELDSWKVGGKMFVCFGDRIDGFCAKTDSIDTAQMLIDAGAATKAPYFHKSWVLVRFDSAADEQRHRIKTSYDIIVKGLTNKAREAL